MPISGREMLKRFLEAGWAIKRKTKGSHVQIQKGAEDETIPMHKELKKGTERFLLKRLNEVG